MFWLGVNPMKALYLSAIFKGVTAPPLIVLILLLARSRVVLGEYRSGRASQLAMGLAALAMTAFPVAALVLS